MKKIINTILFICVPAFLYATDYQTVNCINPWSYAEELICSDKELLDLDREMYLNFIVKWYSDSGIEKGRDSFSSIAKYPMVSMYENFLQKRDQCGADRDCLIGLYYSSNWYWKNYQPDPDVMKYPDKVGTWPSKYSFILMKARQIFTEKGGYYYGKILPFDRTNMLLYLRMEYVKPLAEGVKFTGEMRDLMGKCGDIDLDNIKNYDNTNAKYYKLYKGDIDPHQKGDEYVIFKYNDKKSEGHYVKPTGYYVIVNENSCSLNRQMDIINSKKTKSKNYLVVMVDETLDEDIPHGFINDNGRLYFFVLEQGQVSIGYYSYSNSRSDNVVSKLK